MTKIQKRIKALRIFLNLNEQQSQNISVNDDDDTVLRYDNREYTVITPKEDNLFWQQIPEISARASCISQVRIDWRNVFRILTV